MTMPRLIVEANENNIAQYESFAKFRVPWARLDVDLPIIDDQLIGQLYHDSMDVAESYGRTDDDRKIAKGWRGANLYGPYNNDWFTDFRKKTRLEDRADAVKLYSKIDGHGNFAWHHRVKDTAIYNFLTTHFDELYHVKINFLEPGGYILPHRDKVGGDDCHNQSYYWPVQNNSHTNLQFYGVGSMPLEDGTFFVYDHHSYCHWAFNDSDQVRASILVFGKPAKITQNAIIDSLWKNLIL